MCVLPLQRDASTAYVFPYTQLLWAVCSHRQIISFAVIQPEDLCDICLKCIPPAERPRVTLGISCSPHTCNTWCTHNSSMKYCHFTWIMQQWQKHNVCGFVHSGFGEPYRPLGRRTRSRISFRSICIWFTMCSRDKWRLLMGVILSYSAQVITDNFTVVSYSQLDCTLLRGTLLPEA